MGALLTPFGFHNLLRAALPYRRPPTCGQPQTQCEADPVHTCPPRHTQVLTPYTLQKSSDSQALLARSHWHPSWTFLVSSQHLFLPPSRPLPCSAPKGLLGQLLKRKKEENRKGKGKGTGRPLLLSKIAFRLSLWGWRSVVRWKYLWQIRWQKV